MDEVDVESVDLGDKLRQRVQSSPPPSASHSRFPSRPPAPGSSPAARLGTGQQPSPCPATGSPRCACAVRRLRLAERGPGTGESYCLQPLRLVLPETGLCQRVAGPERRERTCASPRACEYRPPAGRCSVAPSWHLRSHPRRPVGPGHTLADTLVSESQYTQRAERRDFAGPHAARGYQINSTTGSAGEQRAPVGVPRPDHPASTSARAGRRPRRSRRARRRGRPGKPPGCLLVRRSGRNR